VHQVGSVLVKLTLHMIDDASQLAALLDQAGYDVIFVRDHATALCQ
jgi:alkanesulfonate monooxygenase SsuD/methylene tetrahydromethanopterin reductase-like flavin-dependent oxidoreductase (luciferase family)